jgi:hypothetical protein
VWGWEGRAIVDYDYDFKRRGSGSAAASIEREKKHPSDRQTHPNGWKTHAAFLGVAWFDSTAGGREGEPLCVELGCGGMVSVVLRMMDDWMIDRLRSNQIEATRSASQLQARISID